MVVVWWENVTEWMSEGLITIQKLRQEDREFKNNLG